MKDVTAKQVRRLAASMAAVIDFIEASTPEDARRPYADSFDNYRDAMTKPLDTSEGLTYRGKALYWAISFLMENSQSGELPHDVADAFALLAEFGYLTATEQAPGSAASH